MLFEGEFVDELLFPLHLGAGLFPMVVEQNQNGETRLDGIFGVTSGACQSTLFDRIYPRDDFEFAQTTRAG